MPRLWFVLAATLWTGAAFAASEPAYAPVPAWVKPVGVPDASEAGDGAAVKVLLQDSQFDFGSESDRFYSETAVKVVSPQGLGPAGNMSVAWSPDTDTITIHKLNVIRDGRVIDVLAGGKKFSVLRRENNLEWSVLDGALTANLQIEDLRVGDVVDMAVTIERRDPVRQGRSEGAAAMARPGVIGRFHVRAVWPNAKPMRWRATDGLGPTAVSKTSTQTELVFDEKQAEAPHAPLRAPARYARSAVLEMGQFGDWREISQFMAPLYAKAANLAPNSPILAEVQKIKAASADPKVRAIAALRLVQEQVRYVALTMNFGGYVPADADLTWTRRFGDCKGKTVLLLAILRALGIEAEPALVQSANNDGLNERLPMLGQFDHVITRAHIGGVTYWLDGTRLGARNIDDLKTATFQWALPVAAPGAELTKIDQPPLDEPNVEVTTRIDASGGIDAPAPVHVEALYRGDAANYVQLVYQGMTRDNAQRVMRQYWTEQYTWLAPDKVGFAFDDRTGVMRLWMDGAGKLDWSANGSVRDYHVDDSTLGWDANFAREPGPHADAPYAVAYPSYQKQTIVIALPDHGAGFSLEGAPDVDQVIAGVAYHRRSRIENGVATTESSSRSLTPEFPASAADAAATALRRLSDYDVVVRANRPAPRDFVARLDTESMPDPVDAAGFSARGAAFLINDQYAEAVADFTQAAKLEPKVAKHLYNRGVAHFQAGDTALALADFAAALRLNPQSAFALLGRAEIYLGMNDEARARSDFEQAIRLAPSDPMMLVRRAEAYERIGKHQVADGYFGELLKQFPSGKHVVRVQADRCVLRARWGQDPSVGLAECNSALTAEPADSVLLQSRALLKLRLNQYDASIADFDAALSARPTSALSLYGRGVAKLRKGVQAGGQADLAAALKADPKVATELAGYGVKP